MQELSNLDVLKRCFFFFHKLNETLGFDIYGNVFIKMKTGMESEADSQEENVDKLQRWNRGGEIGRAGTDKGKEREIGTER